MQQKKYNDIKENNLKQLGGLIDEFQIMVYPEQFFLKSFINITFLKNLLQT